MLASAAACRHDVHWGWMACRMERAICRHLFGSLEAALVIVGKRAGQARHLSIVANAWNGEQARNPGHDLCW